jgi:integrase
MATRRANGEGNVYQRPDGLWEGRVRYTDPATGQRKRVSVYGTTAKAARAKLKESRDRLEDGAPPRDATRTVGEWLAHWRATTLAASDRKESTRELYATLCRRHLEADPFGTIRLDRLRPSDIEALILAMRAKTKPGKRAPDADDDDAEPAPVRALSDSTVRQVYTILRSGLDGACRDGLLAKNPAALVKRPGVERTEAKHLDANAVTAVLRAAENSRYYPALLLVASTGLRKGECLALKWSDVDLDAGALVVRATLGRIGDRLVISEPKTARSRREVPLHPSVVTMLRKHRTAQKAERLRAASNWQNTELVFTSELGGPVDPRNFLRVIETAAKTAGVQGVGIHTLRHSAAVAWLESGVHIKAVADLLGHSSISVTGDVYGHSSDATARAAIDGLGARLGL